MREWALRSVHGDRRDWPSSSSALSAMGCAVQPLNSELLVHSEALLSALDNGSMEGLGRALDTLLTSVKTEHGLRPLSELDGMIVLDVDVEGPRGYAWLVGDQTVIPWQLQRKDGVVRVQLGDHDSYAKADLDRLWRRGRFPAPLTQWEFYLGPKSAVLLSFDA